MTVRRRLLPLLRGILGSAIGLGFTSAARAECAPDQGPWVAVSFANSAWSEQFRASVLADFRARLAEENISVCAREDAPARPPVARITISAQGNASVDVSVDLNDAVTAKRVGRDVDLSRVPADGRPLAIALAAGELLRASWVEIAFAPAEATPKAPPAEVRRIVQRTLPPREAPAHEPRFGLLAAAEHFGGGQDQLGADAYFLGFLASKLRLRVAAGARESLPVDAEHGRIRASALSLAIGGQLLLFERPRSMDVSLGFGARGALARFQGRGRDGASESDFSSIALYGSLGLDAALRLMGPLWFELGASGGVPLRSVSAEDAGQRVTGMSGFEAAARLGLGVAF